MKRWPGVVSVQSGHLSAAGLWGGLLLVAALPACQRPTDELPGQAVQEYRERMMVWSDDPAGLAQLPQDGPEPVADMVGQVAPDLSSGSIGEAIRRHLADPSQQREMILNVLGDLQAPKEIKLNRNFLERLDSLKRGREQSLTLSDVIRRMLVNNYAIRVAAYQPAIDAARIVEAEAAFDSVFFFNFTNNKQDRPSAAPQLQGTSQENRTFRGGVRKLLSTGTQVQVSYDWNRTFSNQGFLIINPAYTQLISTSMRQPLLRGFGLDLNRSQISISRNDRSISRQQLRRNIRDQLQACEDAYWLLVQSRRTLTIQAELIAYTQDLHDTYEARLGFDVFPAQLAQIRARLESRNADFVRVVNRVFDAEDELKRLMNDPELDLATDVALIPADLPTHEQIVLDRLNLLQTALDYRSELREARLQVQNARIGVGVAKNQALPRFDLSFTVNANSLGVNSDRSFGQLRHFNFLGYVVQVEFEVPVGNRGPRAGVRQARLRYAQAATLVRQSIEDIVADVNLAIRRLSSEFDQLSPRALSANSAEDFLDSVRAREVAKTPEQIETELNSQGALANARQNLLQSLVDYNRAIVNLERAKGTLLAYNRITLDESFDPGDADR